MQYIDETRNSTFDAAHTMTTEMKNAVHVDLPPVGEKFDMIPLLRADLIDKIQFGLCNNYVDVTLAAMRSHGIPLVTDFVPKWGRGVAGHTWCTIFNTYGDELPFDGMTGEWPGGWFLPRVQVKPKIYRKTYAINHDILEYWETAKYPQERLKDWFRRDVTDHYITTVDIPVRIDRDFPLQDKYAYMAVFDMSDLYILDFAKIKRRNVVFRNYGKHIVYLPLAHNGSGLAAISNPIIARLDGTLQILDPDTTVLRTVRLGRKYYRSHQATFMERRLIGGIIEASSHPDFAKADTIYRIDSIWTPHQIPVNPEKKNYRYWRYKGPNGSFCDIAELMFWAEGDTAARYGKIIGTDGAFIANPDYTKEKAFDQDALTCFDAPEPDGGWLGMDFGEPVCIDRVTCIPRSDDNAIFPGQEYELMYWNKTGWVSLGKHVARDKVVVYDNVPENALLILRNRSKGKQERIFTYENGKQVWW